jgi:D-3-phosphoglycerate dehydrogenase
MGEQMTWKVLVSAPYMQPVVDDYRSVFEENGIEVVVPLVNERLSEAELLNWIENIDGAICGDDEFTSKVLNAAKRLKVISKWGTGIDSIDKEAAKKLGIMVCNVPNAFTDPVADTVLGYILSFSRQVPWVDREMRAGKWEKRTCTALRNKTLGVVGVGNIGKAVIRRALGFGMRVLGNDIREISSDFIQETETTMRSLGQLLRESDFVTLNCDLNPTSYHLIGREELSLMRPTAYLINTARGPILEEKALIWALENKRISGTALDVFEVEPLSKDSPLKQFDNCLLSPHNANSSPEAWQRVHEKAIANLLDGLRRKS